MYLRQERKTLLEEQQIAARWEEYIKELFEDDQPLQEIILETAETGPPILRSEVELAVRHMKQGKSPGPDEISTEMLLALEGVGIDLLFDRITKIYETGTFPADMLKSVFVPLPKIPRTLDCTNHRTISLMNHSLKFLLKIILQRIRRKLLPEISEAQYGFMKNRGTRNAIFNTCMLSKRSIKHQQDIYLVFIDYKKAFDKVRHGELFNLLQAIQVDDKDLRILRSVYVHQRAAVRLPKRLTNWVEIKRGVRQGCIASPDLFNLYGESILRPLDEVPVGVSINGVIINNIRYADDIVLIAATEEGLQQLLDEVNSNGESKGLSINHKRTKCMVISKSETPPTCTLKLGDIKIEQVDNFNYLGSVVNSNGRCKKEIRRRISLAKEAFKKMKPILCDRKLSMPIKNRVLQTFVWPVILYGSESWTLNAETRKNIKVAEM